jgi:hypothetical protein
MIIVIISVVVHRESAELGGGSELIHRHMGHDDALLLTALNTRINTPAVPPALNSNTTNQQDQTCSAQSHRSLRGCRGRRGKAAWRPRAPAVP